MLPDLIFAHSNKLYVKRIYKEEMDSLSVKIAFTNKNKIPGDLMDELIRLNLLKQVSSDKSTIKFIFDNNDDKKSNRIEKIIQKFNLEIINND